MKFEDHLGRTVELKECPKRIVSLVPSQTELLFDLGLREEVVGITKFCVHPDDWFRSKTRIGGTKKLHFDKIRALDPDLILANKEENNQEDIELLRREFPVWVSDVASLEDACKLILDIGQIVCKRKEATALSDSVMDAFDALPLIDNRKKRKALYLIWTAPDMVAGSDTFINSMLLQAGLENVITDKRYPELDNCKFESPDVILLSSEPYPFKEKHIQEFQQKFPDALVKIVDGELFSWYGSRLLKSPSYFRELFQEG